MLIDQIRDLYLNKKLSSREVAEKLRINQWRVVSAMRRHNIPRRSASEADHIAFSRKSPSYEKKANLTSEERSLHEAALMLYWAEGSKKNPWTVDFANCDEKMILLFLRVLRRIYKVNENKLRVLLYCYANQNVYKLIDYWSDLLEIPKSKFIKPYVREDFDIKKINKMPHGLVHIRYSDKKLLMQIKAEIDIIQKKLNKLGWRSGQTHCSVKATS